MNKEIVPVDYITKDYEGFRQLMIEKIPIHAPEWTDHSQSDMGIVLVELLAYGLDVLSYYQDKAFNENFLSTAKSRRSVINLCRLLGYELAPQTASRHKIVFTKSSDYWDAEIVIPAGTKLSTNPANGHAILFELDSQVVMPAGVDEETAILTATGYATQGETITEQDFLGTGNATAFQKFKLSYPNALINTVHIQTDGKYPWTLVTDFLASTDTDRHFKTFVNEDGVTEIEVGSGLSGMVVPMGHSVTANYRVGGGAQGNVGLNTINSFVTSGIAGVASFTNPEAPIIIGTDPEDIEIARVNAPRSFRAVTRAVTKQDYEDLCLNYGGILKARANETFNMDNDLHLHIVPTNYATITIEELTNLKAGLLAFLNERKVVSEKLFINPAGDNVYQVVDITVNVTAEANYLNADVKARVESRLKLAFDLKYMEFGEDVSLATIFKEVMLTAGVKDVTVTVPTATVSIPNGSVSSEGVVTHPKIAKLGTVTAVVTGGV